MCDLVSSTLVFILWLNRMICRIRVRVAKARHESSMNRHVRSAVSIFLSPPDFAVLDHLTVATITCDFGALVGGWH